MARKFRLILLAAFFDILFSASDICARELQVGDIVTECDSIAMRPVVASYFAEAGYSGAIDTYLSPLKYSGSRFSLGAEWRKLMNTADHLWTSRFDPRLSSAFMGYRSLPVSLYDFSFYFGKEEKLSILKEPFEEWHKCDVFDIERKIDLPCGQK